MSTLTCSFIGLGLIGGSIAKAIRTAIPQAKLLAYDTNESSLQLAVSEQVIDSAFSESGTDRMRLSLSLRAGCPQHSQSAAFKG